MSSGKIYLFLAFALSLLLVGHYTPSIAPILFPTFGLALSLFLFAENSKSPLGFILIGMLVSELSFNYHVAKDGEAWIKPKIDTALSLDWKIWLCISIITFVAYVYREKISKFINYLD